MSTQVLKRVVRRETHSPRTVVTVVLLVLIALAAVYTGVEIVLSLAGAGPLLVAPGAALAWLVALPGAQPQSAVVAGAAVVAVIGVILVWLALSPGRLPKHQLGLSEHAVVVDNGVIASAVAERVRRELDLPRDGVVVGIGHRGADVTVRPEPGRRIDRSEVREAAEAELQTYSSSPALKVRARVQRTAETEGAS
ncbi:DNA/RNA endonuclease G [Microbacterium marinilacus]|uniref:DNA/RNA endonuclease G n=1 Tax=Microbacterium marinilacus TaxID=415209 RepID=A0ABP7BMF8_9MICO|nr:DNA/RNA endonuclease G [Microbacterium marinilacus]MBY0690456.1 DNA/RNA endonuclease G [Microbacterium marinilacus]